MKVLKTISIIILIELSFVKVYGQLTPINPVSNKIFTPFIYNPAIAGSKDFSSLNAILGINNNLYSGIIAGEGRLTKKGSSYITSTGLREFRNFGLGSYFFKDSYGLSNNIGGAASMSYHIPVNKKKLTFLSLGTSVKGVLNTYEVTSAEDTLNTIKQGDTFFPNVDLGAYFYGKSFHAGFSTNNLLGNPLSPDSLGSFHIPVSKQNIISAGYKVLLVKKINMVVEASFYYEFETFDKDELFQKINPLIKIYMEEFCFGMFFNNKDINSFFFQYRYPGFYLGAYYGLVKNSPFYLNKPLMEFSLGLNLSRKDINHLRNSHW